MLSLAGVLLLTFAAQEGPVPVLFDTDMDGDCDDVAALALLHALADRGEARILATVASSRSPSTPSCIDAINTWYGRGDLPVGVPRTGIARPSAFAAAVAKACPNDLRSLEDAGDALEIYRRVLQAEADRSVILVTVGFLTNVSALLRSPGGEDLVRRKVKRWVCMGGNFIGRPAKDDLKLGNVNFQKDPEGARTAVRGWPGALTFVGRETVSVPSGLKVGRAFAGLPAGHPVRVAYEAYFGGTCKDRHVADPGTVLFAVRGTGDRWTLEGPGRMDLADDLTFEWRPEPDGRHEYLLRIGPDQDRVIERTIESLVLAPPRGR